MQMYRLFVGFITLCFLIACSSGGENTTQTEADASKKDAPNKQHEKKMDTPEITIPSADELPISTRIYEAGPDAPVLVLCHQASSANEEYAESAPKLKAMGFTCVAPDLRSGGDRLGGINKTNKLAQQQHKATTYLDAEQDINAAVNFAAEKYGKPVILVGSSYSAALALKVGHENDNVKAVAAFSPGEYFKKEKDGSYIRDAMKGFSKPLFLTSSQREGPQAKMFYDVAESELKIQFVPTVEGIHGARALWASVDGNEEYWTAFTAFLEQVK